MNYWTQSNDNIYVAAHRGWCARYPENTMEAFRAAIELGVDQIETDVRMTADGQLVLIHDATVDRTTDGSGSVCDMTLAQLRQLDAGIKKGEQFAGCVIPTMEELMELVRDHPTMTLDIELKDYPHLLGEKRAFEACDKALEMIARYGFEDRFVINSFSTELHRHIREKYGSRYKHHVFYPIEHMTVADEAIYDYAYCACVFGLKEGKITPADALAFARRTGVRVWAGASAKDEATVAQAIEAGCQLITCNNPDQVLGILRAMGKHK